MDDNDEKDVADYNDGRRGHADVGDDEDDDGVTCAPSALFNRFDYNDGGHADVDDDEGDDVVTFAPSALGNHSSPPQSSPSCSATWQA